MPSTQNESHSLLTQVVVSAVVGALSAYLVVSAFPKSQQFPEQVREEVVQLIEEESVTVDVVDRVFPSVVSVVVRRPSQTLTAPSLFFGFNPDDPFSFIDPRIETPVIEEDGDELIEVGGGTAFFVTADGMLLTNRHVVDEEGARYFIVTTDGDEYEVEVVDRDPIYDVAVLRLLDNQDMPEQGFPFLPLAQGDVQIGQTVIAIGNSLAEFPNTVTKGVVSGTNRRLSASGAGGASIIRQAIQTDAAINSGNSGGPLVNLRGEVVGINTAVSRAGQSIAFAIPIQIGQRAISDVAEFGRIVRPWLGVRYTMLNERNATLYFSGQENPPTQGAYLDALTDGVIVEGSPAEEAGLEPGDIILRVEDMELTESFDLAEAINRFAPEDTVVLTVDRGGEVITLSATLGEFGILDEE